MAVPILMPKLGLTMETGVVVSWRKKEGDRVEKGEPILEVETDKIVTEVQSPHSGTLLKVLVPQGAEVKVQTVLAVVGETGEDLSGYRPETTGALPPTGEAAARAASEEPAAQEAGGRLHITPRARRLLKEKGLTLGDLEGLGKARITEADVQEFLARAQSRPAPARPPEGQGQMRQLSRIEKIVAARMTESFRDIPQFSLRLVAEIDRLLDDLPRMKDESGADISINDLVLRATAIALSRFPDVQGQFREEGIYVPAAVGLGFAVALGRDLVVPVIRDADRKRIGEISREAADMAERAKSHRLRPEDLVGGTFTVSNLGMFGVSSFVPIVNPGESAILGVGAVQTVPRIHGGAAVTGRVIELTLVCDHRSVNGSTAAVFCRELKKVLESPEDEPW